MKALILNSGIGKRMGDLTKTTNKCMAKIDGETTILDRQLELLQKVGVKKVLITTGPFAEQLSQYVSEKYPALSFEFVWNEKYETTNYIYSIYLAKEKLEEELVLLHGDLVFEESVLSDILKTRESAMVVDSTLPLPEKDFKAVIKEDHVHKVGIEFFEDAYAAQALYHLKEEDAKRWLEKIAQFCEEGNTGVYAENALNTITDRLIIRPFDVKGRLCAEIDNLDDLEMIKSRLSVM